ncbi:MAG: DNA repair protein RecN [Acidaminococcus sp.]|jgi:DNA repair protein RecN (Recombination protein N)|nr:DNA repair protein RecN [Acidaminococcus sp.]MCI2099408.1 DNA repair protein RecN [Acidaminococcus sp.]MCI2113768.1 DNA repair protein RecN [Acidaminococcus sp.]MCI2115658.1 DNA repair protein RecN [Acidaminococcus sp.]
MLTSLEIHHFALIDRLRVEFSDGFNVFTGETGAGKSILIDALGIVLGGRASAVYLRDGADSYDIQAIFDLSDAPQAEAALKDLALDGEDDLLFLRRRVAASGKSQAFVNDRQVPLKVLSRLGSLLVDIHGQHENQFLLRPEAPLTILDHYIKELAPALASYREAYNAYQETSKELQYWQGKHLHQGDDLARLEADINEIEEAQIKIGEDSELRDTVKKLSYHDKIMQALSTAHTLLEGEEGGVLDGVTEARKAIDQVSSLDETLAPLSESLDSAWQTLEDVRQNVADRLASDEDVSEALNEAQSRLDLLYHLKQKYGGTLEAVLSYAEKAREEYESLEKLSETIEKWAKETEAAKKIMLEKAAALTALRKKGAEAFCKAMLPHIHDLAMPEGKVEIAFSKLPQCGRNGQDEATFLFSANLGMKPQPLGKIASGGELSRFALAVKTVLLEKFGVPTMIFDEIDTGVGGVTAQKMAEKIALISARRQVLCVTHLPQIACFADRHLYISKAAKDGSTVSSVKVLDTEGQVEELMRMTSGTQVSESARTNARELLAMAASYKNKMKE